MDKLYLKTLSPIHVGSGEQANGLSYIVDSSKIYFLDFEQLLKIFSESQFSEFVKWIEENTTRIEREGNWDRKRQLQREFNLKTFIKSQLRNNELFKKVFESSKYQLPTFGRIYDNVNIDYFIKAPDNKPYIPGSEIKGAFRTAVLYQLLKQNDNYNELKNEILKFKERFKNSLPLVKDKKTGWFINESDLGSISDEELQRIFGEKRARGIKENIKKGNKAKIQVKNIKNTLVKEMNKIEENMQIRLMRGLDKDAKYDVLKLLSISDSEDKKPEDCLFVSPIKVVGERFTLFYELCKEGAEFISPFSLSSNSLISSTLGFSENQRRIIHSVDNLLQYCYEFSERLLKEEIKYFERSEHSEFSSIIQKLKEIKKQNTLKAPLIHIGKGQGYLSLTVNMLIKDKDPDLYNSVIVHATKGKSYSSNFPKTRRVVVIQRKNQKNYLPLGWIKLTVQTN